MAITNAEMAEAWGELLELTPEQITQLAGLLDQWALGGARLATLARLTTDVSTFNDAAIRMVHDWYGGEATGGPNGDGLYPLMNSDAEVFLVPSPAKIMAGVSGLDPKGTLASEADLPATEAQGDLWVIDGVAWVWSASAAAWVNQGPFQGPQGEQGLQGARGDQGDVGPKGDTGDQGVPGDVGPKGDVGDTGPKGDKGDTGDTGPKGDKGDRGDAFTVDAQGDLAGRAAYDAEPVGFSYLDVENGSLYFRIAPSGWSGAIPFGKGDKGDKGDQGDPGDEGPQGPPGADGADGTDATVVFATVTEIRAGNVSGKAVDPATLVDADGYVPVTADGAFTLDFSTGRKFKVTMTANSTMSITGLAKEISGVIRFQQDATGGRTLAVNAAIKKVGSYTLSTAANAVDRCGVEICGGVAELTALEKGIS